MRSLIWWGINALTERMSNPCHLMCHKHSSMAKERGSHDSDFRIEKREDHVADATPLDSKGHEWHEA